MVVGASGVLNVGSLTALTPHSEAYNTFKNTTTNWNGAAIQPEENAITTALGALKTSSTGNINIQGKVFSRGDVNLHAKNINIGNADTSKKTGVFAGVSNFDGTAETSNITTESQAEMLFNALVSNNVTSGKTFGLNNGKIAILAKGGVIAVAKDAEDTSSKTWSEYLEDAGETAVDILGLENSLILGSLLSGASVQDIDEGAATVNIQNAVLAARGIDITAQSDVLFTATAGSVASVLDLLVGDDNVTFTDFGTQFFGDDGFDNFVGARAKAEVNINEGAVLKATNDINLASTAVATTNIKTPKVYRMNLSSINGDPDEIFYAVGAKTVSNVNINSGAKVEALGNLELSALSKNSAIIKMNNTGALKELDILPNLQLSVINYTNQADTNAVIHSGGVIKAANVNTQAVNFTNELINIKNVATYSPIKYVGTFSAAASVLMKHDAINTNAIVDTTINTIGDVDVTAQNLFISSSTTAATAQQLKEEKATKTANSSKALTPVKSLSNKVKLLKNPTLTDIGIQGDENNIELSGAVLINNENITANAEIGSNAKIMTADKVNVNANNVNLTINKAIAASGKAETASAGGAVVVNNQNTNSYARIAGALKNSTGKVVTDANGVPVAYSTVNARNGVTVNATTELPLNEQTLQFAFTVADTATEIYFGLSGDTSEQGAWDLSSLSGISDSLGDVIANVKPIAMGIKQIGLTRTLGLEGFLNNYAQSSAGSGNNGVALAGSVVYSDIVNNTIAEIGDYAEITSSHGDITVNAANDIIYNNAAGTIKSLLKPLGVTGGLAGIGGSILISNNTANAKALIGDNAKITAPEGTVGLYSGSQQIYVNIGVTGGSAQTVAIDGTVLVSDTEGDTLSNVGNSTINAKNLTVSSGKGAKMAHSIKVWDQFETLGTPDSNTVDAYLRYLSKKEAKDTKPDFEYLEPSDKLWANDATQEVIDAAITAWQNAQETIWDAQYKISDAENDANATMTPILEKINSNQTAIDAVVDKINDNRTSMTDAESVTYDADFVALATKIQDGTATDADISTYKAKLYSGLSTTEKETYDNRSNTALYAGLTDSQAALYMEYKTAVAGETDSSTAPIIKVKTLNSDGLIDTTEARAITDKVSAINFGGALAKQSETYKVKEGAPAGAKTPTSSSGVAVGATVIVNQVDRNVFSNIADGALINLSDNLNVISETETKGINVALAGAFAGGVSVQKSKQDATNNGSGNPAGNQKAQNVGGWQTIIQTILSKLGSKTTEQQGNPSFVGNTNPNTLDKHGRPKLVVGGKEYVTDKNKQYYDPSTGKVLTDANGKPVAYQGSLGEKSNAELNSELEKANQSRNSISVAAAGAVNAQINKIAVESKVGNAVINVGKDVNIASKQETRFLNISGGVAKAGTVGAGAALNLYMNESSTNSILGIDNNNTDLMLKFTDINADNGNKLSVTASDYVENIDVATGVGVTVANPDSSKNTAVAVGGSFNVSILENAVNASINDAIISKTSDVNTIDIAVTANNYTKLYKGAGGLGVSVPQADTSFAMGAGLANNDNSFDKTTTATINNSTITQAKSVNVEVNNKYKEKTVDGQTVKVPEITEDAISVAVAGSVVTGAQASFNLQGAFGVDIYTNTIKAQINNSTLTVSNDINVASTDYIREVNADGALGIGMSPKGVGVGIGVIVNVIDNKIDSSINDTTITKADNIKVEVTDKEELYLVAVNMGIQTGGTSPAIDVNGISNISISEISSGITDSEIDGVTGTVDVLTDYEVDSLIVTAAGAVATGAAIGANAVVNVLLNDNTAKVENTSIKNGTDATGKLTVNASSAEDMIIIPASIAVSNGSVSVAGNITFNYVMNATKAYIDNSGKIISSRGVEVTASDLTTSRSRGGTVSVSSSSAAVGGSLVIDTYMKDVEAYIDNVVIEKGGDIVVNAVAENTFGVKNPASISASGLASAISGNEIDLTKNADDTENENLGSEYLDIFNWEMTFDASGSSSSAAVSGSLLSKIVINNVEAYIGSGVGINSAADISVSAKNEMSVSGIVGNVTGSAGSAAVGGSLFSTVNVSDVSARIDDNVKIGSLSERVGDISIEAKSIQNYSTIMFVIGGASSAAVNGSLNSNVIVNQTNAYIGKNTDIYGTSLSVNASDKTNIQSLNLAVSAGGSAGVGGIAYVNVLSTDINSEIGKKDDTEITGIIDVTNSVDVKSVSQQDFSANMLSVAGSGSASVTGIAIATGIGVKTTATVSNVDISADKVNVNAENQYNDPTKTANLVAYLADKGDKASKADADSSDAEMEAARITSDDFNNTSLVPLTTALSVAGSGAVAVTGTLVVNVVSSTVNAEVSNSIIKAGEGGLNIIAENRVTTYDVLAGVAGAGNVSVGATAITNIAVNSTKALMDFVDVKSGDVSLSASDKLNLNGILFMGSGAGTGAAVSAIVNVNTIVNDVIAKITGGTVTDGDVNVTAVNDADLTTAGVVVAGVGVGAGVSPLVFSNTVAGSEEATISSLKINKGSANVYAQNDVDLNVAIIGGNLAGTGAAVGVYAPINVVVNEVKASIQSLEADENVSSSAKAISNVDIWDMAAVVGFSGVGASVSATAFVNVIDNEITAEVLNSEITGGAVSIVADQSTSMRGGAFAANVSGVGAGVGANIVTNIFNDTVAAYSENSNYTDAALSVTAEADETVDMIVIQANGAGEGAGVSGSAIINTVSNDLKAYVGGGTFNNTDAAKNISVNATQNTQLTNSTGQASVGTAGVGAGAIVNVLNNKDLAYIKSTEINTKGDINVNAISSESIKNTVIAASGGAFAGGLLVDVNVIETETYAYINSGSKNITAKNINVKAADTLSTNNLTQIGSLAAAAASAGVTINVVNNAVKSEILSSDATGALTTAVINAEKIKADSSSTTDIDVRTGSYSIGIAGLSGAIAVTSVGDRFKNPTSDQTYLKTDDDSNVFAKTQTAANNKNTTTSLNPVKSNIQKDNNGNVIQYTIDDTDENNNPIIASQITEDNLWASDKSYTPQSISLMSGAGTAKEGTIATIKANVTSKGSIDVVSKNTSDINQNNVSAGLGYFGGGGANILVANSNYNVVSEITGSNINASGNDVTVKSESNVKSNSEAFAAGTGAYALAGNVAVFNNDSKTSAIVENSTIKGVDKLTVSSISTDSLKSKALSGTVGGATLVVNVVVAETNNEVKSKITGNVDIEAKDAEISSSVKSDLSSELLAVSVSGATVQAIVNKSISNVVSEALIDATGSLKIDNNLNIISYNNGIKASNAFYAGTLALFSAGATYQGAFVNSTFNAGINNPNLTITALNGGFVDNIVISAGVTSDKTTAGTLATEVTTKNASATLLSASVTDENAKINSKNNVKAVAKTLKAENLTISSKSRKTALTGSNSGSISTVEMSALLMKSDIKGSNTINLDGDIAVNNTLTVALQDYSQAKSNMIDASLSILDEVINEIKTNVDVDTTINLNGKINAKNTNIAAEVERSSYSTAEQKSFALVELGATEMNAEVSGDSYINYNATSKSEGFANEIDILSKVKNTVEDYMSSEEVALDALAQEETKNKLNTTNKIKLTNADIQSSGKFKASVENETGTALTKTSLFKGFLAIVGGKITNDVNAEVGVETYNASISAKNIEIASSTDLNTMDSVMKYEDSTKSFAVKRDAVLKNNVSQANNITIGGNSQFETIENVDIDLVNSASFDQAVNIRSRGFSDAGDITSPLVVKNDNAINIKGGSDITAGNRIDIDFNSNNTLSSNASINSSSFAGTPTADSTITLFINNTITEETGSVLQAGNSVDISFMKESRNTLIQYSYTWAQAAIATPESKGGIFYNNNNTIDVNSGALISSLKNVTLDYGTGSNYFSSTNATKAVSRIVLGIPITKTASASAVMTTYQNKLINNGTIEAGTGGQKKLVIDPDGKVNEAESSGFLSAEYVKTDSGVINQTERAVAEINNQIVDLTEEIAQYDNAIAANNSDKGKYEAMVALADSISTKYSFKLEDVINYMKSTIGTAAINASGYDQWETAIGATGPHSQTKYETNEKLDSSSFLDLWDEIKDITNEAELNAILGNGTRDSGTFTYEAEATITLYQYNNADTEIISQTSSTGTIQKNLVTSQVNAIKAAWQAEQDKFSTVDLGLGFILDTYNINGENVCIFNTKTDKDAALASLDNIKSVYNSFISKLESENQRYTSQKTALSNDILSLQSQITSLNENPLPTITVDRPTYVFDSIGVKPAVIEISGLSTLEGAGQFKTYGRGLTVDNYSDYDLIFNNITLGTSSADLLINGTAYNGSNGSIVGFTPSVEHSVRRTYDSTGDENIHISTYFDHNNPLDAKTDAADIKFLGDIRNTISGRHIDVFNDSGDITFDGVVNTSIKNIIASQGNISFNSLIGSIAIQSGGNVIAGQDILINANSITNNGTVKAGNLNRNITIDNDLYNLLTLDSKAVNNMPKTLGSTYLNETNNIKAIKDADGNIHLYNTDATSGTITLNANTKSGNGTYTYSDGYGNVNIINNTDHKLVVHNLNNNYELGEMKGADGTKISNAAAITNITSNNADLEFVELLSSANKGISDTGAGLTSITAKSINLAQSAQFDLTGTSGLTSTNGMTIAGAFNNRKGSSKFSNTTTKNLNIASTAKITTVGNLEINNAGSGALTVANGSSTENSGIKLLLKNTGNGGLNAAGSVKNDGGLLSLENTAGTAEVATTGLLENKNGNLEVVKSGDGGVVIAGTVQNNDGKLEITNAETGLNGITISGNVLNIKGVTDIVNNAPSATAGIVLTESGRISNTNGDINTKNIGGKGTNIEGLITAQAGNINITNANSDIIIGENNNSANSNGVISAYINAVKDNVNINQTNGDILNGVTLTGSSYYDLGTPDYAYKTLIAAGNNLDIAVIDGNVGYTDNVNPGFGVNASTRDYTDSVNVNIGNRINVSALNSNTANNDGRLINLRSRFSDMKVGLVEAAGDIILTSADWKQNDNVNGGVGEYYVGYSILNDTNNGVENVKGKNISIISSDKIGSSFAKLNVYQDIAEGENRWVSYEAENDINTNDLSPIATNIWQMISKRGSIETILGGMSGTNIIRSITAGDHLHIVNKGKNLTIYDLGIEINMAGIDEDMLYPHDRIALVGDNRNVIPKSVTLEVLDMEGGADANSTLNVYNAYLKGRDANDTTVSDLTILGVPQLASDVTIKADNVIAHSGNASSSTVQTINRLTKDTEGYNYNAATGRNYYNNPFAATHPENEQQLTATGFNSFGEGDAITFDIRGVNPDIVSKYGDATKRAYYAQDIITTLEVFSNPLAIKEPNYKAKDVTLTLNMDENPSGNLNRGLTIDRLLVDDTYIQTEDLNLNVVDATVNNYGEFINGNRGGTAYSHPGRTYRYRTIVDNLYRRELLLDTYVTLQLYTQKTGSFGLTLGDVIVMQTMAPPVHYNPYEVTNLPRNENSFYRLTYKDDKIQNTTTTPEFKDFDKSTNSKTRRESLRFEDSGIRVNSERTADISIYNISKTGMEIDNADNVQVGEKIKLKLQINDDLSEIDAKVMRKSPDGKIGVQFINLDKATANKLLFLNMKAEKNRSGQISQR